MPKVTFLGAEDDTPVSTLVLDHKGESISLPLGVEVEVPAGLDLPKGYKFEQGKASEGVKGSND